MKRCIKLILIIVIFLSFPVTALCTDDDVSDAVDTDKLQDSIPEEAEDVLDDMSVENVSLDKGIGNLWDKLKESFGDILKDTLKSGCTVLLTVIISGVTVSFFDSNDMVKRCVRLVSTLAITAVAVTNVNSFISMGASVLDEINSFSKILLPTLTGALAASGAAVSATAKYAITSLFMDILITISNSLVIPLVYGYVAVSCASCAFGGKALSGIIGFLKWMMTALLTAIVTAFTLYITLTGVINSSTDIAAVKLTKTAISAFPVVGGVISDAAGAVVSAFSILKNSVGIFGLLAVCGICAVPMLKLLVHYFVFKGAAALSKTVSDSGVSELVSSIGSASGFIIGMVGAVGMMLFISVISVLRTVTGA